MPKLEKIKNEIGLYKYQLKNGDVTYYYKYKDSYGKTQDVRVGRSSESYRINDARIARTAAIAKDRENPEALLIKKNRKKNIITFQDLADRYYKDKAKMKSYQDSINKYNDKIEPIFGKKNVLSIKFEDLEQYQADLLERYAPATVNYFDLRLN